jgi:hypothetical protein
MRAFVLGLSLVLASSVAALAGEEIMAGYFGNTVVGKSAMGESRVHYRADHTFTGTAKGLLGSMALKGTWKFNEQGQFCRTYDTPSPDLPNPLCTEWAAHKVGDSWEWSGRTITLLAGEQ